MMDSKHRQFRLKARCPSCGAPVRLRNRPLAIEILTEALRAGHRSEGVLQTYQCARKLTRGGTCNTIVEIRLSDWVPEDF